MSSQKAFASTGDMTEKKISFTEVGPGLFAFTAEGDPNTGVIVGDDCCAVFDAQATPAMARQVIERVRSVTDKPIKYVILSHYHAVRVLGASAYQAQGIVASQETYRLVGERGKQDWDSEFGRFPRLFRDAQSIPGLTWPTLAFAKEMTLYLGKREVKLMQLGAGHTSGDIVAWVPDAGVMFTGDLIEYHSACYCGDAHLRAWPHTLNAIRDFNPKYLVVSAGMDIYADDPLGKIKVTTDGTIEIGKRISALGLPTIIIMEGGYNNEALGRNIIGLLGGFN